jgi:hypothetical protein
MSRLAADGLVWQATAAVVPLLVQLLQTPRIGDKDWILTYLGHLARSSVRDKCPGGGEEHPGVPVQPPRDLEWLRDTRIAVDAGSATYIPFLDHDDPMHRVAAGYALSFCGRDPIPISDILRRRLKKEPTDLVRAALLFGLHQVGDMMDGPLFREYLGGECGHLAAWSAAAGLVLHWERQAEPDAIDVLLKCISTPGPVRSLYRLFPWGSGDLSRDTGEILARATPKAAGDIVPHLIHVFGTAGPVDSLVIAFAILALTFPDKDTPTSPSALSELQRRVLITFAHSHRLGSESPLKQLLESRGLPSNRSHLLALASEQS